MRESRKGILRFVWSQLPKLLGLPADVRLLHCREITVNGIKFLGFRAESPDLPLVKEAHEIPIFDGRDFFSVDRAA